MKPEKYEISDRLICNYVGRILLSAMALTISLNMLFSYTHLDGHKLAYILYSMCAAGATILLVWDFKVVYEINEQMEEAENQSTTKSEDE